MVAASHVNGFDSHAEQAILTQDTFLPRSLKLATISKQWNTAAEKCECKPQVWEERWPRLLGIVKIRFTCELTAIEADLSTVPQI